MTRNRSRNPHQIGPIAPVLGDGGEGVHGAILAHRDGVDLFGPLAVGEKDGPVVDVLPRRNIIGDEVQILLPLRFALLCNTFSRHPLSTTINRPTGQVMQGLSIRAEDEPQVSITELIKHPAALRRQ